MDALALDGVFTHAALVGGADHLLPADLDSRLPAGNLGDEPGRTLACARHTLLCVACYERARFEESRLHGLQALACATEETRFGEVFVDTCLGMAAMAQGCVEEAGRRYRRARRGSQEVLLLRSLPHREHRRAADRARSRAEPREGDPAADPEEPDGVAGSLGRRLLDMGRGERRADARALRQPGGHQAAVEGGRRGAEALARGLCTVASEHGLTRTLLRGLALSMDVAHRAGLPESGARSSGRFPSYRAPHGLHEAAGAPSQDGRREPWG